MTKKLTGVGTTMSFSDKLKENLKQLGQTFKTIGTNMVLKPAATVLGALHSCDPDWYSGSDLCDGIRDGFFKGSPDTHKDRSEHTYIFDGTEGRYYGPASKKHAAMTVIADKRFTQPPAIVVDFDNYYPMHDKAGQLVQDSVSSVYHPITWDDVETLKKLGYIYSESSSTDIPNFGAFIPSIDHLYRQLGWKKKMGGQLNYLNFFK